MHSISKLQNINFYYCCTCNKTVDRVESYYDPMTCATIISAHCHGDKETSILPDYYLYDNIEINEARCFDRKKLEVKDELFSCS